MKILMLIASLDVGGAETHVVSLCRGLTDLGHSVHVASGGGRLCRELEKMGVEHTRLPLYSHSPIKLFVAVLLLLRLVKRIKPCIIHSHSRIASFLGEIVARKTKTVFVTTAHAYFSCGRLSKRLSRWGYRTVAVSDDIAEHLRERYFVFGDRIEVIGNGVDTERTARPRQNKTVIAFASRLDADCSEAAYSLCRISERLACRFPKLEIRIIGGGSEYAAVRKLAARQNERLGASVIRLTGNVESVKENISDATVFVGVGRCAIEAMTEAIPVIVAGNEGYFGAVDKENVSVASSGNFCARGFEGISDERLFSDLCAVLQMSADSHKELGDFLCGFAVGHHGVMEIAKRTEAFYVQACRSVSFGKHGVCLCGYYGYGNTGDDTLLDMAIERARELCGKDGVTALTAKPKTDRYRFGTPCYRRYSPFSVIKAVWSCRVLAFGGGTLFQDSTSLRSMLYYSFVACLALMSGKRVELWGNGLSLPRHRISRFFLSTVLRRADYIGLRDKPSLEIAIACGAKKGKVRLEGDLAMRLKKEDEVKSPRVVNTVCGIGRYAVFGVSKRRAEREIAILLKRAESAKNSGTSIITVAMYKAEDERACRDFASKAGGIYADGFSAKELIGLLSQAEFCISARLHLLIFARIANIPFECVGNDPKLIAFCEENGEE